MFVTNPGVVARERLREKASCGATIRVKGVIQGVGFRPFVYQLATKLHLTGWVRNTSGEVEIELSGPGAAIDAFVEKLKEKAPPLARLQEVTVARHAPGEHTGFHIRPSLEQEGRYQLVSPDIATCDPCLREVLDPRDRRFGYPFTNCTNCGPRFTIIQDIPYDRARTTMRRFSMCPDCQREYEDPTHRRFHTQPNACPVCGPSLELVDGEGEVVARDDALGKAAQLLRQGKVVAVKGLGGFLLACDATSAASVRCLRQRKRRASKPLAVMVTGLEEARRHCCLSPSEEELLASPQAPIVLLRWKKSESNIVEEVAPGLNYLGVMLPYTPLHHLLLRATGLPLVMTSGNISDEPIARENNEALWRLRRVADFFLLHDRDIYARYDDSVFMVEGGVPQPLRRARGYAPYPIRLAFQAQQVLGCGAHLKNTFCITRDSYAFLSQHIGDLENVETLQHYESTLALYKHLFRLEPRIVAHDLHPDYLASRYAVALGEADPGLLLVPVQHHHAHVASCLAEHGERGPVIGVALDGLGYGANGTLWGGEFLIADLAGFRRAAHLEEVPLPGGAAAILRPYRMAVSYIHTFLGDGSWRRVPSLAALDPAEEMVVLRQVERGLNAPLTSSAGRLFDAVSAIAGVRSRVEYEAQAAMELEMQAPPEEEALMMGCYPFSVEEKAAPSTGSGQDCQVVRLGELIEAVVRDASAGASASVISGRFHNTVAAIIVEVCRRLRRETGLSTVVLSGGVFQNRLLFRLSVRGLEREGLKVLTHRLVPANDGGLSLGQAVIGHFVASGERSQACA